jgi:hypothetical protein
LNRVDTRLLADKIEVMTDENEASAEEEKLKKFRCIVSAHNKWRSHWEYFILLLAVWNGFSIPYNVAFYDPEDTNLIYDLFNYLTDVLFFMDVLINFRTTYIDDLTNEEIFDPKRIAIQYLKGRF